MAKHSPEKLARDALQKKAKRLIARAKKEKKQFETSMREAFKFCMPHRIRPGDQSKTESKKDDDVELCTSIGIDVLGDFASDMHNTFTPREQSWGEFEDRGVGATTSEAKQIEDLVKLIGDAIFEEVQDSNFYDVMPAAWKDFGISTMAITISQRKSIEPLFVQVVPIPELLILKGPFGDIDVRFREWRVMSDEVETLWPDIKLPAKIKAKVNNTKEPTEFVAIEGGWRDRSKPDETWQFVTLLDNQMIDDFVREGRGSAPIFVGRMNPDPGYSWGIGPAIDARPEFRTLDELEYLKLKGVAFSVDPAGTYDDDGVLNLEAGLEPGRYYPQEPGSKVNQLQVSHQIDVAFFEKEELESAIKRKFFQEKPRQRGKTPPSASQFLEEQQDNTARLSTPTAPLWSEFLSEVLLGFMWNMVSLARLPDGLNVEQLARIKPINPLERAARQNDVLVAIRFLETLGFSGPQAQLIVNWLKTAENIQDRLGDDLVVLNDEATFKSLVQAAAQSGLDEGQGTGDA